MRSMLTLALTCFLLLPGLASDYAAMIRAALALYEATGDRDYLDRALVWQQVFDAHLPKSERPVFSRTV